jgi:hypothetical protein
MKHNIKNNNTQHKDIQHNDNDHKDTVQQYTEHNDIQHSNEYNVTLSIMALNTECCCAQCHYPEFCYAECCGTLTIAFENMEKLNIS